MIDDFLEAKGRLVSWSESVFATCPVNIHRLVGEYLQSIASGSFV